MKTRLLLSVVCLVASWAFGADWYVAKSGTYVDDKGVEHPALTTIAAALNWDSGAQKGDTIWIEDGYVDDASVVSSPYGKSRIYVRRSVTLRSKSGTYDEAKGLGVKLVGAPHSATTAVGSDAVRGCTVFNNDSGTAVLQGFVFVDGCSEASYGGGGIYCAKSLLVTNCLFRGNTGKNGGAVSGGSTACYDCVFSNNVATSSGGAVYQASLVKCSVISNSCVSLGGGVYGAPVVSNCLVALNVQSNNGSSNGGGGIAVTANGQKVFNTVVSNNWAVAYGGGINCYQYGAVISNCTLIGNMTGRYLNGTGASYGHGGGVYCQNLSYKTTAYDCTFVGNTAYQRGNQGEGGGAFGVTLVGGTVRGNVATVNGGGCKDCVLTDVQVVGNVATNETDTASRGGGLYTCTATNCLIAGNFATAPNGGSGGGTCDSTLVGCIVSNNTAKSSGGGVYWSSGSYGPIANCVIIDNTCGDQGGGVWSSVTGATLYNCLIARNAGDSNVGAGGAMGYTYGGTITPLTLVNCTVTGNNGGDNRASGIGGVRYVNLVNTIVWGNRATNAEYKDTQVANVSSAVNSTCSVDLSSKGDGNSTVDPKLTDDARLKARSPCRGTGYYNAAEMPWAADPNDPRHLDLAGNGRLNGSSIDRGCYTYVPLSGMVLLVR